MDRFNIYENATDVGRCLNLVGVAVTGVITAVGFVDAKILKPRRVRTTNPATSRKTDTTVVDFSERNAH